MIIVKGFLYVITPTPARGWYKQVPVFGIFWDENICGTPLDVPDGQSQPLPFRKDLYRISKGSPLHTTYAGSSNE